MFIGTHRCKKAVQVASAFAFAAALVFIANIVVATAKEMQQLDPTITGIEAIDKNRVPPSLKDALAELRTYTAEQRDEAMVAARKLVDEIRQAAIAAAQRLESASTANMEQATEAKKAFDGLLEDAEKQIEEAQNAAAETWISARNALADALELAAAKIDANG